MRQPTRAWPYVLPALLAALAFVVLPMVFTVFIGFTNRSSTNLLDFERARAQLRDESVVVQGTAREFVLVHDPALGGVRVLLRPSARDAQAWISPVLPEANDEHAERGEKTDKAKLALALTPWAPADDAGNVAMAKKALPWHAVVDALPQLRSVALETPTGELLQLISLREFAQRDRLYNATADGAMVDRLTGKRHAPDDRVGFFVSADGERLQPGYQVNVGTTHYQKLFGDAKFREPFVSVLTWTVLFAALSVSGAAGLGLLLASLLNWDRLRFANVYRLLLFLPYAVPGFLSILIFKGLFNQNLGEVNLILDALFGIKPAWFSDPWLAKVMLVLVNIWLGFPYMMIICTGLLQSIPADLREASAEAGAGPWTHFRRVVMPLIIKPMLPLLIAAFAFNFNNFVLVSLLTGGRPDLPDTTLPAGTTDILVSYTWRMAFNDSGQQYGLAAAISTVIFALVAVLTVLQLRLTRSVQAERQTP